MTPTSNACGRSWECMRAASRRSLRLATDWRDKDEKEKHTRSLAAIGARLGIFIFSLWFLCMSILTWGTAQYVFSDLATGGIDYAEYALMSGRLDDWFSLDDEYAQSRHNVPGALEYNMNMAIACAKRGLISPRFDGYPSMEKPLVYLMTNTLIVIQP